MSKDLDLFVTVKLLGDTPAVLSLGKFCEEHGYSFEWTSGHLHLLKNGRRIRCNTENLVPIVVPGLSTRSSSSATRTSATSDSEASTFRPAITRSQSKSSQVRRDPLRSKETENKKQIVDRSSTGETRCAICMNGWKSLHRILWTRGFRHSGAHPQALLVNRKQQRRKK